MAALTLLALAASASRVTARTDVAHGTTRSGRRRGGWCAEGGAQLDRPIDPIQIERQYRILPEAAVG